jgi:hypothetical protein
MLRIWVFASSVLLSSVAAAAPRVAVQPFSGPRPDSEQVRRMVARIVAKHGFRVLTSIPAVAGTGQYPQLARDKEVKAFVVADTDVRGQRVSATFLIWQGLDGSVVGRWEMAASKRKMARIVGKEFWKRLGPAVEKAIAPPSNHLPPAPTMRIDASSSSDEDLRGRRLGAR